MEKLRHLDTFTGYGGFTISAQKLGWETVGFSEIDKYASAILKYNFSNIKNYGNISDIDFRQFRGEIDIITGGTPCQDLSVAGKGKGLEGERSGLFFEFIRAVTESEATYFVWENVKGALWSNKGWDFARVQIEMEQAGYDVWWQVINAKDFGVPQNRERIFAIGIRKGSGREILFEQRGSGKDINKIVDTGHDGTNGNVHSLDANYWKGSNNPNKSRRSQIAVREATKKGYAVAEEGDSINLSVPNSKTRRGRVGKGVAQTLDTASNQATLEGMRIRRLTPTECERLMGLEDNWTAKGIMDGEEVEISDTQRYKMCGNGVVVNCVDYIYKIIKDNK
jgi:DNA (cytosine-5)-methyltransferase 1